LETDYEDLAQETTARALGAFKKKATQGNGWRPDGGASLKTYFSRALLYQFANVWRGHLRTDAAEALPLDEVADIRSTAPNPEDLLVQQDLIRRGLADVPNEKTRVALALTEEGFDQEEIAEILGITKRAVEGLLRRHRERIAAMADEDRR
jgi:RNA polymerase sigma factor (sigma-70 family)